MPDLIVGALIALCGVFISQIVSIIQAWINRKYERKVLLRAKYEELGIHFLESMKLFTALIKCKSSEEIMSLTYQASGNNMHLLALIYFPLLQPATGNYLEASSNLINTVASLHNSLDTRYSGEQLIGNPKYDIARESYIASRNHLQDQIVCYASTYADA